jgi:hypothetical protein
VQGAYVATAEPVEVRKHHRSGVGGAQLFVVTAEPRACGVAHQRDPLGDEAADPVGEAPAETGPAVGPDHGPHGRGDDQHCRDEDQDHADDDVDHGASPFVGCC